MAQWVNRLWNNIFCKSATISYVPLLCEISGALHLAQSGVMVDWQAKNTSEF